MAWGAPNNPPAQRPRSPAASGTRHVSSDLPGCADRLGQRRILQHIQPAACAFCSPLYPPEQHLRLLDTMPLSSLCRPSYHGNSNLPTRQFHTFSSVPYRFWPWRAECIDRAWTRHGTRKWTAPGSGGILWRAGSVRGTLTKQHARNRCASSVLVIGSSTRATGPNSRRSPWPRTN